jgi:hypothetical protein
VENGQPEPSVIERVVRLIMRRGAVDEATARQRIREAAEKLGVSELDIAESLLRNEFPDQP